MNKTIREPKEGEYHLHIFHILRSHHDSSYKKSMHISGIDSKPRIVLAEPINIDIGHNIH